MHCSNCGTPLPEGARFCMGCGTAVEGPPESIAAEPSTKATVGPAPTTSVPFRPQKTGSSCLGIGCISIIGLFILIGVIATCSNPSSNSSGSSGTSSVTIRNTPEPTSTPEPTAPPTESPEQRKKDFLQGVDESISGDRIAGNPYKFVGDDVDLHGTVQNVLDDSHFNMSTGDIGSGNYAIILVETDPGDATNLEANQSIRVLGTVEQPTEGTNAMGGSGEFPTVKAEFME